MKRSVDPLDDPRHLRQRAIAVLVDLMEEPITEDSERSQRVTMCSAAARILSHTEWREERESVPEQALIALMGDPTKALAWMRSMVPRLEAMTAKAVLSERSEEDGEGK